MSDEISTASETGEAFQDSMYLGDADQVMSLFKTLDAQGLAGVLNNAGFYVDDSLVESGRNAVFLSVKSDIEAALELKVDGHGLKQVRQGFAAKDLGTSLNFDPADFDGDSEAAKVIQGVLRSSAITVSLLGTAKANERPVLLNIAGQGLSIGRQGFGFEGVAGKYAVPLSLREVVDLHKTAARALAVETTGVALNHWANGGKVGDLGELVPDSVQRHLQGGISLVAAKAVVAALEDQTIVKHAGDKGVHAITSLLAAQGLDVSAKTIQEHAVDLGLTIKEANRDRGNYFGPVVAADHRAGLVKFAVSSALELPFADLPVNQERPKVGEPVRVGFKDGAMSVSIVGRPGREGVGR